MSAEPIRWIIDIAAPRAHVFDVLTRELSDWWPREFTFSDERFAGASIDHLIGGEWFEVTGDGERLSWGDVVEWEPPAKLVLTWRVAVDRTQELPENASEIEIRLVELTPVTTQLELEHRNLDRHGAGAASMRAGMASEQGWPAIVERLRAAAVGSHDVS